MEFCKDRRRGYRVQKDTHTCEHLIYAKDGTAEKWIKICSFKKSVGSISEEKVTVTQSCTTLCDPMGCSPPEFSVHWIYQARILEWVAISFSRASSRPGHWTRISWIGRQIPYHWATREGTVDLQYQVSFKIYNKVIQLHINTYTHRYVYVYVLFQILLHYRLSQDIEYSSMCYIVGSRCLFILHIVVCIC